MFEIECIMFREDIKFQLVGHVIKGGGLAISGQEQSLLYKRDNIEPVKRELNFIFTYFARI